MLGDPNPDLLHPVQSDEFLPPIIIVGVKARFAYQPLLEVRLVFGKERSQH